MPQRRRRVKALAKKVSGKQKLANNPTGQDVKAKMVSLLSGPFGYSGMIKGYRMPKRRRLKALTRKASHKQKLAGNPAGQHVKKNVKAKTVSIVSGLFGYGGTIKGCKMAKRRRCFKTSVKKKASRKQKLADNPPRGQGRALVEGDNSKMPHDLSDEGVQETVSEEVFNKYQSTDLIQGAQEHPGDIVEAACLSDIPLPGATYNLAASIPRHIMTEGKLSRLQLEGILYACQRHQKILPNGNRAGFFIGDAAGVGKGRQIAGIILDNYVRGRTKHIWFSISADLIDDAQRDLHDIGCRIKVIKGCQQLDKETKGHKLSEDFKQGVIFCTYSTLISSTRKGAQPGYEYQSRLYQLIRWCGSEEFSGCLIFDECHKAKQLTPGNNNKSSKIALAVTEIQSKLPHARVLYCSATGVTGIKNMAFMERLGLWGDGTGFRSFNDFKMAIKEGGLGAAEMLAMEMKASGMYVSRGLSFKQAEFITVEMDLTEAQVKMYNDAADVWVQLRNALRAALKRTNADRPEVWSAFALNHQQFFKQLCLGLKVPRIVEEAKKALADGYCVVIGLQSTGEASLNSMLEQGNGNHRGFVSVARGIYSRFVDKHFPTIDRSNGKDDPWSLAAKERLLSFAQRMTLPNCPLDELIDQLGGPSAVAEMTGRKGRMIRDGPNAMACYKLRTLSKSLNVKSLNLKEKNSFMAGDKLVAIISDAASIGISLHADANAKNQRRRLHLTVELPWAAEKAIQQMGRSHRSNQTSGPLYELLTTNLGGERRFAASVARKLQILGALSKGDRRAATGANLTQFNFDSSYGHSALRTMFESIYSNKLAPGVSLSSICPEETDAKISDLNTGFRECISTMSLTNLFECTNPKINERCVKKFLNRILGLKVEKQNLIFNYFNECLQAVIANAKRNGKYDEGLVDIKASSVEMVCPPKTVFKEANTSMPVQLLSLSVDRGLSWEAAVKRLEQFTGKHDGFYCSKRGKTLYILATQTEDSTHPFKIARPNTGMSSSNMDYKELKSKYQPVSIKKAVGARLLHMDLLCGGIVPLLSTLRATIKEHTHDLMSESRMQRPVRVQLSNGKRVIGIRYSECLVETAEEMIQDQKWREIGEFMETSYMYWYGNYGPTPRTSVDLSQQSKLAKIEPESPVNPELFKKAVTAPDCKGDSRSLAIPPADDRKAGRKERVAIVPYEGATPYPPRSSKAVGHLQSVEVKNRENEDDKDAMCYLVIDDESDNIPKTLTGTDEQRGCAGTQQQMTESVTEAPPKQGGKPTKDGSFEKETVDLARSEEEKNRKSGNNTDEDCIYIVFEDEPDVTPEPEEMISQDLYFEQETVDLTKNEEIESREAEDDSDEDCYIVTEDELRSTPQKLNGTDRHRGCKPQKRMARSVVEGEIVDLTKNEEVKNGEAEDDSEEDCYIVSEDEPDVTPQTLTGADKHTDREPKLELTESEEDTGTVQERMPTQGVEKKATCVDNFSGHATPANIEDCSFSSGKIESADSLNDTTNIESHSSCSPGTKRPLEDANKGDTKKPKVEA